MPGWRTGLNPVGAAMKRGTELSRGRKAFGKSRDGAPKGERAPQADARGNAERPWRAPHWLRIRMRSSEAPVRYLD